MANSQINISINAQDNASVAINSTTNSLSRMRQNIDMAAHSLQAYTLGLEVLKNQLIPFATAGIAANAQLESLQTKLTGLISANSANVTSTGEVINAQQKWQLSSEVASEALERLKSIATATGNEVSATTDAFTMFYATANDQGSATQAMDAFNAIALAAQVAGKDMASLVPMFDSLATGTVLAGSEMGSFMKIVGLTNEELKLANQNGTLFATLQERLAEFGSVAKLSAGTYKMELNKLKSSISDLMSEASKPIFDSLKNRNKTRILGLLFHFSIMTAALILCKKLKTELNSSFKSEYIVLSSFLTAVKKLLKNRVFFF